VNQRCCSVALISIACALSAFGDTVDFEGFPDGTPLTTQYAGLVFSDATVITAGASLNELEFPPTSGNNVAFDNGGPITITFLTPVADVSAFFTYASALTLTAFDNLSNTVASATSLFSGNFVSSGNPPDELISLSYLAGISEVTIAGDPAGGSFTMDDLSFTTQPATVPEPSVTALLALAFGSIAVAQRVRDRKRRS
jgi:hypothetical protein